MPEVNYCRLRLTIPENELDESRPVIDEMQRKGAVHRSTVQVQRRGWSCTTVAYGGRGIVLACPRAAERSLRDSA